MKRLIKYHSPYKNDGATFSNCSTNYEVLPVIVDDNANLADLKRIAVKLGIDFVSTKIKVESPRWSGIKITESIRLREKVEGVVGWDNNKEMLYQYLGFITIPEIDVPLHESINNPVTNQLLNDAICNSYNSGIIQIIELDSIPHLLLESWDAFHAFRLNGYIKFDYMLASLEIAETVFDDSVFCCSGCSEWDYNDSGYTYNYRIIGCEQFGINCGCAHEAMKNNIDEYVNDSNQCVESEVASDLEENGEIEKIETFIGGMVDGRGGYINGESVREGQSDQVLQDALEEDEEGQFIFVREDSGQFQTYFSLYKFL